MGQDTFGYDQAGYDVQLTGNRAENGAQALPGYQPDVRPDTTWPGLDGSGQIRVKPDEVKAVADWLTAQADTTRSLPQWLAQATSVSFGPSSWHEAGNLKAASDLISQAVTKYIGETVANMGQAAATLTSVHSNYTKTEQANVGAVQQTNAGLGDGVIPTA